MKKLLINIVLFILPIWIVVLLLPVNKRLLYLGLENDCSNHAKWIYDRLNNNTKPIDILFLGTSQTLNSINEKIIERELNPKVLHIANMGYCRPGRDLAYVLLKETLLTKNPKVVFIEVREDEGRYSHPIFPYLAKTSDVLMANKFFNRDYFTDVWTHFIYKLDIFQDQLYQSYDFVPINTQDFGHGTTSDTASLSYLEEIKTKRSIPGPQLSDIERNFYMRFSRHYLYKIDKFCRQHNIKLFFLYLPSYGIQTKIPNEYNTYVDYGEVIIPPFEIFNDPFNWYDEDHLNYSGSEKLSHWIAREIKRKNY
ncbi:MAG: hypothetical protein K9G76_06020 [Bacteroidales bacterium]|nr:hypothetical protein [Bacteroidales bacterium]MCF8402415.1 hypothetical protein [Bacteroidales bacterium]